MTAIVAPRDGITLLPHQVRGVRWMIEREKPDAPLCCGGVLADDMGLGKTFQVIALMKTACVATLIVCPPALVASWTDELRACGFRVSTLMQGTGKWSSGGVGDGALCWLTTYSKLTLYRRAFDGLTVERMVLDEGHAIRGGRGSSRWEAANTVAMNVRARWILSATPVQNSLSDWENYCAWLRVLTKESDAVGSKETGGSKEPQGKGKGKSLGSYLEGAAATIMLRRTMADIPESAPPAPIFYDHQLSITPGTPEYTLFRGLCDRLETALAGDAIPAVVLVLYMRIQQFLVHPQIYIEAQRKAMGVGAYPRADWNTGRDGATKWSAFLRCLEMAVDDGGGSIVFCQFRREVEMVSAAAVEAGARSFVIRGGLSASRMRRVVADAEAAVAAGSAVVVAVQIVAGGVGLNLQFCRRVLFLSRHWNPAIVHQAVGRAVRIGQRAVVEVHCFSVVDAVLLNLDRRMVERHDEKLDAAWAVDDSFFEGFMGPELEAFGSVPADSDTDPDD